MSRVLNVKINIGEREIYTYKTRKTVLQKTLFFHKFSCPTFNMSHIRVCDIKFEKRTLFLCVLLFAKVIRSINVSYAL